MRSQPRGSAQRSPQPRHGLAAPAPLPLRRSLLRLSSRLAPLVMAVVAVAPLACGARHREPPADPLDTAFTYPGLTTQATDGRRLFIARCAPCHGADGRGDGPNAYNLDPPPPDFSQSLSKVSPTMVETIIRQGTAAAGRSPLCPPRGRALTERQVHHLKAFLAALRDGWKLDGKRSGS
jgi:mono/diheme cytochrome c family protein